MHRAYQCKEKSNLLCEIEILGGEPGIFTDKANIQEKLASSNLIFCTGIRMEYESP